jgi:hypothetical protein
MGRGNLKPAVATPRKTLARPEDISNVEGNTMAAREELLPRFAVGSQVRVKKSTTAPNHTDMSLGGWCGKVYQVSGTICFVHWNEATLQAIHPILRERLRRDGVDFQVMWLQDVVLEVDPGEPLCLEQPKEELRSTG